MTATAPELLSQLEEGLDRGLRCGAVPFEVIAGTPSAHYGARVTLLHPEWRSGVLGAAFGISQHPWGPPRWVGLRVKRGGGLRVKAYHPLDRLDARFALPTGWPQDLEPVMAALDGEVVEVYLNKRAPSAFEPFARRCLAVLGSEPPEPRPCPAPRERGLGVSLRRERGEVTAVTLFADWRALPPDPEIERAWSAGMSEEELLAYRLALAGAQTTGFLPRGNWHAVLAWTVEADGSRHRAVSLTLAPPPARTPAP